MIFLVSIGIIIEVRHDNLNKTDVEKEKSDGQRVMTGVGWGCALTLIIIIIVCFIVFDFLSGMSFDPSDLIPEIRNPFH